MYFKTGDFEKIVHFCQFFISAFFSFRLVSLFSFIISLPNKVPNCFVLRVEGKHVTQTDTQLLLCNVYSQYRYDSWFYVLWHTVGSISSDKPCFGVRQPERQSTILRQESFQSIQLWRNIGETRISGCILRFSANQLQVSLTRGYLCYTIFKINKW